MNIKQGVLKLAFATTTLFGLAEGAQYLYNGLGKGYEFGNEKLASAAVYKINQGITPSQTELKALAIDKEHEENGGRAVSLLLAGTVLGALARKKGKPEHKAFT